MSIRTVNSASYAYESIGGLVDRAAGMTYVNSDNVDDTPTGPFGGEKNSGICRFEGEWIMNSRGITG